MYHETIPIIVTVPKITQLKLKFCAVTGHSYGEKSTVRRNVFHTEAITQNGVENLPFDHFASTKSPRVKIKRRVGMRAYAATVGTPPADTREVKATAEGRIEQRRTDETIPMKMMALRGCPLESTLPIHEEPGRIPSRATAKTKRDAAVIARLVF